MSKQKIIFAVLAVLVVVAGTFFFVKNRTSSQAEPTPNPAASLPVNTIPVQERPFITLTPDESGRHLFVGVDHAPEGAKLEYELVYQAGDKQEGVFGRIDLSKEEQPFEKKQLLGSQSAGGKITYHEDITSGSLAVTYDDIKLKEQFNFLRFDPEVPSVSSSDVRFSAEFEPDAFGKDDVIVVMKSFGLPAELTANLIAGPYSYFGASQAEGDVVVSLKLPAGEHNNPTLLVYDAEADAWTNLAAKFEGDTLTASVDGGNVFVVTAD